MNEDMVREKINPILEALLEKANMKENSVVGDALRKDMELALFLVCAVDFVGIAPEALVGNACVMEDGEHTGEHVTVKVRLPIPALFEAFYNARLANASGESMAEAMSIVVMSRKEEPSNDRPH